MLSYDLKKKKSKYHEICYLIDSLKTFQVLKVKLKVNFETVCMPPMQFLDILKLHKFRQDNNALDIIHRTQLK